MWTNKEDPVMTCQPLGLPRQGPPRRIYQSEKDITFLYNQYADAGGGLGEFRVVPTDGRKHRPEAEFDAKYYGDTVGHWEGDTLVLDSIGFTDRTWFGRGGFFHTSSMHIVERFTRQGNTILYEVTVEDPEVLVEPWVLAPRTLVPNANPDAGLCRSEVIARCTKTWLKSTRFGTRRHHEQPPVARVLGRGVSCVRSMTARSKASVYFTAFHRLTS